MLRDIKLIIKILDALPRNSPNDISLTNGYSLGQPMVWQEVLELIQNNLPLSVAEYCDVAISSLMTEAEMRIFQGLGLLQPSGLVSLGDIKKGSSKRAKKDSSKSKPFAPNVGAIAKGVVARLEPYGAFVQLQAFRGKGLVHRSQLGGPLGVNDEVFVKVIDVTMERDDRSGNIHQKISLSTKNINQESGTDMAKTAMRS